VNDFSDDSAGWEVPASHESKGAGDVEGGHYRLRLNQGQTNIWATPGDTVTDFYYQVTINWPNQQEAKHGAGILFRLEATRGYMFEIDQTGLYRARYLGNGSWQNLKDWTQSSAIQTGTAVNKLAVQAIGSELRFDINGINVYTVNDTTRHDQGYTQGDLGLVVAHDSATNAEVTAHFDDVMVRTENP
jgi:hypothetical protein